MVSKSLRHVHRNDASAIKMIGGVSGINLNTIAKWYRGINAPKSAHLLMLARLYPQILRSLLEMIGREDIYLELQPKYSPEIANLGSPKKRQNGSIWRDIFVHINVILEISLARNLNQRQIWFIGQIQNGRRIGAQELAEVWQKSQRTIRRDIRELAELGIIRHHKANKTGYYVAVEQEL